MFVCALQSVHSPSAAAHKECAEILVGLVRFFIYKANLRGVESVNKHLRADQQLRDDNGTKAVIDLSNQLAQDVRNQIVSFTR